MATGWRQWEKNPEVEGTLVDRARGDLGEMESTKQIVELIGEVYRPGMRVLDVGCNAGHYLRGLRRLDAELEYVGVDAYSHYIDQAAEIYAEDEHARFEVKDIHEPLFPDEPFDVVYSCNVILHLPDFRTPLRNLLESTREVCFVRTLLGERTTKVRRAVVEELDSDGEPVEWIFQNTWSREIVQREIESLGWTSEIIQDTFDPTVLAEEFDTLKKGVGTNVIGDRQVDGSIIFNWEWLKITRP